MICLRWRLEPFYGTLLIRQSASFVLPPSSLSFYVSLIYLAYQIPVTYVDPLLDAVTEEFLALDAPGSTLIEGRVYSGKNPAYNSTEMSGLPCGIQIVGGQWEEEKVIEMMKVVDGALGERGFGPGSYTKRELAKVV